MQQICNLSNTWVFSVQIIVQNRPSYFMTSTHEKNMIIIGKIHAFTRQNLQETSKKRWMHLKTRGFPCVNPKLAKSEQNSWVRMSQYGFRQGYKTRGLETSPSFLKGLVA